MDNFCKKDVYNEIKRDLEFYVYLNLVLVIYIFVLFDSYVIKIIFLLCVFYFVLDSLCYLK